MSSNAAAAELARQSRRIKDLERAVGKLNHSALHNAAIPVYDSSGTVRQVFGQQVDGTFTTVDLNGPNPPQPTKATLEVRNGALVVTWDGRFEGGALPPADWSHVEVHVDLSGPDFACNDGNQVSTMVSNKGGSVTLALPAFEHFVKLVAVSTSRVESTPSVVASATPLPALSEEAGDLPAPSASPEVTVTGLPRTLLLQIPVQGLTTTVAFHIGTDPAFVPDATTLIRSTRATIVEVTQTPDGMPLDPSVTYYIKTVASNVTGTAAPSAAVEARLRLVTSDDIVDLAVDKLVGGEITAAIALLGSLGIGGITIDPDNGIVIPQASGTSTIFPADGTANKFGGDAELMSALIRGALNIQGTDNWLSGSMQLGVGTSDPLVPPTVGTALARVNTALSEDWSYHGLVVADNAWVTAFNFFGCNVGIVANDGSIYYVFSDDNSALSSALIPYGITRIGDTWYILGYDTKRSNKTYVYYYDHNFTTKLGEYSTDFSPSSARLPTIGNDGTNLLIAQASASGTMFIDKVPVSGVGAGTSTARYNLGAWDTDVTAVQIGDWYGQSDRIVLASRTKGIRVYDALTRARKTAEEPDTPGSNGCLGMAFGSMFGGAVNPALSNGYRWWVMDANFNMLSLSNFNGTSPTVQYSFYDSTAPTAETLPSPPVTKTFKPGAYVTVTTPLPPYNGDANDPDSVRLYGSLTGPVTLQSTLNPTAPGVPAQTTAVFDQFVIGVKNPETVNGFLGRSGAVGSLISGAADTIGRLIALLGDGSGRTGWNRWTTTGAAVNMLGLRSPTTNQTIPANTFTTVTLAAPPAHSGGGINYASSVATITEAGVYTVSGAVDLDVGGTGKRQMRIEGYTTEAAGSGTTLAYAERGANANAHAALSDSVDVYLPAGTNVRLLVWHDNGSSLALDNAHQQARLSLRRVG